MSIPISGYELVTIITEMSSHRLDPLIEVSFGSETSYLELKSDLEPKDKKCEPGHNIDDYYWHVTLGLLALANSSGGVLVVGISESKTGCEPVELNVGKDFEKYKRNVLNKIVNHTRTETVIRNGTRTDRATSKAQWETALESAHGVGVWSIDHKRLEERCNLLPHTFKGKQVLAILVRPVPLGESLLVAEFEPAGSDRREQCVFVRGRGSYGMVRKIEDLAQLHEHQKERNLYEPGQFSYLMAFLDSFYPTESAEYRLKKAYGLIRHYREQGKVCFLPLPDVNLATEEGRQDTAPVGLVFSGADYPIAFRGMPFELGSSLGLDRGSYLLLTDAPFEQVHAALVRSEGILRKELERVGTLDFVPERWWLRLDLAKCPSGLNDREDILQSRLVPDDELVKGLRWCGQWRRPDDGRRVIAGLLIEAHASQLQSVAQWCRQALCRMEQVPRRSLAVVVSLCGAGEGGEPAASVLLKARAALTCHEEIGIPVLAGRWTGASAVVQQQSPEPSDSLFGVLPAAPGCGVYTLLEHLRKTHREAAPEQFRARPALQAVISALQKIRSHLQEKNPLDAEDVAHDLENLSGWGADAPFSDRKLRRELYRDVLEVVDQFGTPSQKRLLIARLARSGNEEIRLASLRFASRSPILIDWWVEGAGETEVCYPSLEQLILLQPVAGRPVLQLLVLAMIRASKESPALLRIVDKSYKRYLLSEFRRLLEIPSRGMAISECTDALVPIAMLAARSLNLSGFEQLGNDAFASPYIWWTLHSIQVQREWLARVLRLDPPERAVVGLVNSDAVAAFSEETRAWVLESRRGLPVSGSPFAAVDPQGGMPC